MNSSVWAVWTAQGSKEENKFDYFLVAFESVFTAFHGQILKFECKKGVAL